MDNSFIGEIVLFAGNFAPRGFMLCQGQLLPISQYTAVFSILGTTYGGDGVTTFALPDLRGAVPVGQGQGPGRSSYVLGEMAGTENTTLTSNQMPIHTHGATAVINASARSDAETPAGGVMGPIANTNIYATAPDNVTTMNAGMATVTLANAGSSQAFSILQPYLTLNYIICIEGIFPSRN